MNILYLTNNSKLYGANRSLLDQLIYLSDKNNQVYIGMPADGELYEKAILLNATPIIFPKVSGYTLLAKGTKKKHWIKYYLKRIVDPVRLLCVSLEILKFCKVKHIDIIHSNSSAIVAGAICAWILGVKHIWHIREVLQGHYGLQFVLPNFMMRFLAHKSSIIIPISNFVKKETMHWVGGCKDIRVIYDGINPPPCKDGTDTTKGKKVFSLIGVKHPSKGFECAIEAANLLKEKHIDDFEIYLIGGENNQYENLLADKIAKLGLSDCVKLIDYQDNVGIYMQQSYCGMMCSYMEGLGRTTVEFMLCGRPVIGSNSGGTSEVIEDGKSGFLYKHGDFVDLAQKIEYAINHPDEIQKMGDYAKAYAEDKFSSVKYAEKISKLYNQVLLRTINAQ